MAAPVLTFSVTLRMMIILSVSEAPELRLSREQLKLPRISCNKEGFTVREKNQRVKRGHTDYTHKAVSPDVLFHCCNHDEIHVLTI
jgi:hypothetical protein